MSYDVDPIVSDQMLAELRRIVTRAQQGAPHSLWTNGYRRQRRKHGRKGWPGRKERHKAALLTTFVNWELGLPPRSVVVVPK